jgi:heme-degrading monooxygenase HmoA
MSYENTDPAVSVVDQLRSGHSGPVIMIGSYVVAPGQMDAFLEAWTALANVMKAQPGFLSSQVHRAIGGANVFMNYAVWESLAAFQAAYDNPVFWETHKNMPKDFVGRQLLVQKIAIPGLCVV